MALPTPERNNYFYGKLLDTASLRREQDYFNGKRRLLNRLVTGSGIVCGLNVVRNEDGSLNVQPGVAIDALGREIVVAEAHRVEDPSRLTDGQGVLTDESLNEGDIVEICLAYREVLADLVPALVPDCGIRDGCVASTVREEYCVLLRPVGEEPSQPSHCDLGQFPLPVDGALYAAISDRVRQACPDEPPVSDPGCSWSACVPIAHVSLPVSSEDAIQRPEGAPLVYSNPLLYELLQCLADRVTDLAQGQTIRYVSGDNQVASLGSTLSNPLAVEVLDREAGPAVGVTVEFEVVRGGGYMIGIGGMTIREAHAEVSHRRNRRILVTRTNARGRAYARWLLGRAHRVQVSRVRAVGTPLTVTFRATATKS